MIKCSVPRNSTYWPRLHFCDHLNHKGTRKCNTILSHAQSKGESEIFSKHFKLPQQFNIYHQNQIFLLEQYILNLCPCIFSRSVMPTLRDLLDCSPPGSSVHGILQAKILEWVAISSSRGSS